LSSRTLDEWRALSPEVHALIAMEHNIVLPPRGDRSLILFQHFQAVVSSAPPLPLLQPPIASPPPVASRPPSSSATGLTIRVPLSALRPTAARFPPPASSPFPSASAPFAAPPPALPVVPRSVPTSFARSPPSSPPLLTPATASDALPAAVLDAIHSSQAGLLLHVRDLHLRLSTLQASHDSALASLAVPVSAPSAGHSLSSSLPPPVPALPSALPHLSAFFAPSAVPPSLPAPAALSYADLSSAAFASAVSSSPALPSAHLLLSASQRLPSPFPHASPSFPPPSDDSEFRLPSIDAAILEKIRVGKYIDLSKLVSHAALDPREGFQMVLDTDADSGNPSVNVVPRSFRCTIRSFHEWLTAFLSFAQAYLRYFPSKAGGLMAYLAQLTMFSTRYPLRNWLLYDRQFRHKMALFHPASFWGVEDKPLFDLCLAGLRLATSAASDSASSSATCFRCGVLGHFASSCPRSAAASAFPSVTPPFPAPQRWPRADLAPPLLPSQSFRRPRPSSFSFASNVCRLFNASGHCSRERCDYAHTCTSCGGRHHASACTSRPRS
jgi:hypothetical protein